MHINMLIFVEEIYKKGICTFIRKRIDISKMSNERRRSQQRDILKAKEASMEHIVTWLMNEVEQGQRKIVKGYKLFRARDRKLGRAIITLILKGHCI